MSEIEEMLAISSKFKFGYKKSEALISLDRTPNNTFPLFWCKKKRDGESWCAPFYR
jgi:hypothetical protein